MKHHNVLHSAFQSVKVSGRRAGTAMVPFISTLHLRGLLLLFIWCRCSDTGTWAGFWRSFWRWRYRVHSKRVWWCCWRSRASSQWPRLCMGTHVWQNLLIKNHHIVWRPCDIRPADGEDCLWSLILLSASICLFPLTLAAGDASKLACHLCGDGSRGWSASAPVTVRGTISMAVMHSSPACLVLSWSWTIWIESWL